MFYHLRVLLTEDVVNRDLERRIVETEMELAQAKSQGYLKNQKSLSSSSSVKGFRFILGSS